MDFDRKLLVGQTALVTGAGANIGRAIALEMAREGASIVAVDIEEPALKALADELSDLGNNDGAPVHTLVADMSDEASIDRLLDRLRELRLEVDVLVNNVGIHTDLGGSREGEFSNWRRTLDTNLIGPYHLTRRIARQMIDRGAAGNIVFISSIHQWQIRGHPAYSASKAAIGMVIKELADEYAGYGIRVNGVAPGAVQPDELVGQAVYKTVPLHGTAIPASFIGRNVVVLAAQHFSKYTTGSVITVDAGLLARGFYGGRKKPV